MLFQTPPIDGLEAEVLETIEETRRRLRHLLYEPRRWHGLLRRSVATDNIRASTAIEGHHVSRDDALAAFDQAEPFEADKADWEAVRGYRDAMDYICRIAEDPHMRYSTGLLKSIHYMIMRHHPSCRPGLYRPGAIFVSGGDGPRYEGPAPEAVPDLVEELIGVLNHSDDRVAALVRAGMAHLNLLMIHPFKDGNGRMSRALHTLVIGSGGALDPRFSSIEEYLGYETPAYCRVLAEVGGRTWDPRRGARLWVRFILRAHHFQARLMAWRVEQADRIWERISGMADEAGLNERNMGSLYNAAAGFRVRRHDHMNYAEVGERTATSDLMKMAQLGFLVPVGERRGRYYTASERLLALADAGAPPSIPDPFDR